MLLAFYDLLRKGYDWCRLVGSGYLGPQTGCPELEKFMASMILSITTSKD